MALAHIIDTYSGFAIIVRSTAPKSHLGPDSI